MATQSSENQSAGSRASGSSFYAAMRILPRDQRDAMYEVYSFCRAVDDIADSDLNRGERLRQLDAWREDIDAIYTGKPPERLTALARWVQQFGLRRQDFLDVIDGMEMDAQTDIRAPDFETLDLYCDRVASAVGRLSVRIFGMPDQDGVSLAYHLGRALQLTNILRDVDEDAGIGRLYMPREALQGAGINTTDPKTAVSHPNLSKACEPVVDRAEAHYAEARRIINRSPRKAVRAPRIMGEVYHAILEGMVARGWSLPRPRVSIPRARLVWILFRYALV